MGDERINPGPPLQSVPGPEPRTSGQRVLAALRRRLAAVRAWLLPRLLGQLGQDSLSIAVAVARNPALIQELARTGRDLATEIAERGPLYAVVAASGADVLATDPTLSADAVPVVKIPETLGWKPAIELSVSGGLIVLLFKLALILPMVQLAGELLKNLFGAPDISALQEHNIPTDVETRNDETAIEEPVTADR
jgi:hypothetical protein